MCNERRRKKKKPPFASLSSKPGGPEAPGGPLVIFVIEEAHILTEPAKESWESSLSLSSTLLCVLSWVVEERGVFPLHVDEPTTPGFGTI